MTTFYKLLKTASKPKFPKRSEILAICDRKLARTQNLVKVDDVDWHYNNPFA